MTRPLVSGNDEEWEEIARKLLEKKADEEKKSEQQAAAGLGALFG